jgi:hypothetical protein
MRARVFIESPEDVQECIRLILLYFGLVHRGAPRPIYGRAIKRACRVLKVMALPHDTGLKWMLPGEYKERMKLAGLDPGDPLRVVNQRRWDNAWRQLVETGTFRDDRARADIATGRRSARAEARVNAIAVRPKRGRVAGEATFKLPKLTGK